MNVISWNRTHWRMPRAQRPTPRVREEGRIVAMVPLASLTALICVGIGVDFSGQTIAEQDLRDQAAYCARVGSEASTLGATNTVQAIDIAYQCLSNHGLTGAVTSDGTSITVDVHSTYTTKMLTIVAVNQLPVHGVASSNILQGR